MDASHDDRRPAELVASVASVRARLADAARAAGRDPFSVTLIGVTKTFPASDIAILLSLGILDVGESRDQEARAKLAELDAASPVGPNSGGALAVEPRLHFIGRLQTNKCRSVARYAHCVHTVDRLEIATGLAEGVRATGRQPLGVFVQVSLDADPSRGGVDRAHFETLADAVDANDQLTLLGVMAVAPIGAAPEQAYQQVADVSVALRERHSHAAAISVGMSGDFTIAVKYGATHVRIGSALLGRREDSFS